MKGYQTEFIELARACNVLQFGQFELKSGRTSPYFFNAGKFSTGRAMATLGRCYAQCIVDSGVEFDLLLGPAYKGIPLGTATAIALADQHGINVPFAYNRKEVKAHGEGGSLVGASLVGRALVIDDVITAGTAVREVLTMIEDAGATLAGVVIGLDRQERGVGQVSAVQELRQAHEIPVISIIALEHIIDYLGSAGAESAELLGAMQHYREQFGAIVDS